MLALIPTQANTWANTGVYQRLDAMLTFSGANDCYRD